jgi:hypothetical protein
MLNQVLLMLFQEIRREGGEGVAKQRQELQLEILFDFILP